MAINKVEKLRKARGWTRLELAEKVGMSHSAVTKIERGERRIPDDRAREFARVFGVSAGEVIEGVEELQRVPVIDVAALPAIALGEERPVVDKTLVIQSERSGLVAVEFWGDVMFGSGGIDGRVKADVIKTQTTLILDPADRDGKGIFLAVSGPQIRVATHAELSTRIKPLAKIIQIIGVPTT